MSSPVKVIERLSIVAPLGMRFWDAVTNAFVGSGLVVTAYPPGRRASTSQATVNRAAIYGFHHLTALRDVENGLGDAAYWSSLPLAKPFIVEVMDLEGRFLPCSFTVNAPLKGMFSLLCESPVSPLSPLSSPVEAVPLFSTANRSLPAGMAVIRAQLWDAGQNQSAAWALVEAYPPGEPPVRGVADAQGVLTLVFPYPEPVTPPLGSPLGSPLGAGRVPLWQQSWPIPVQAFYSPRRPIPAMPDLCDVLTQSPATLWLTQSPPQPLSVATLRYGQELILRSESGDEDVRLSELFITAASSSP